MSQADRHHDLLHTIMEKKKIPPPNRELLEAYINTIVANENLESGQPAPQQEAQTTDGSDQLTVFQVRGFRRDIMMYQDQPRESNRLLRILRRLRSKHIPKTVLFDTGIEKSLGLLCNHQNVRVRDAAISLKTQWVIQYSDTDRESSFCHFPVDLAGMRADLSHQFGLVRDMGRAMMARQTDPPLSSCAGESSSRSSQGNCNDNHKTNLESIIKNLGPTCTDTLASVEGETSTALSESDPTSRTGLPNTDFRALALGKLRERLPPIKPVRSKEDFVSFVKSITGLDKRSIELLRYDLGVSYDGTAMNLNSACWTLAAKHTIRACSIITQENLSKKITALARLEDQDDEYETASPTSTRKILLQDKANLEQTLEKQKAELKEASEMHEEFLTDILISTIIPLRFVIEEICGVHAKTRSLFGSDPKAGVRTIPDLEAETKSALSELVATRMQLAKAHSEKNALKAQLDGSRQARAELKKSIASERSSMNNKYYKDIEARVEDRVRRDKSRLAEAEAKSHQYDAVKTDHSRLQDELQKAVSEIERFKAAKLDFDVRFTDLKKKEQATQQGYEQMRERKQESDMRAVTLEAQLRVVEADMEEARDSLRASDSSVALPSQEEAAETSQSKSSTIEIVKYNQQLTETDRLDMIARRWRNDLQSAVEQHLQSAVEQHLQSAVEQQETYRESLQDTEAQIVLAIKQLEELQGPTTRGKQSKKLKKALKTAEAKIVVIASNVEEIHGPTTPGGGGSSAAADEVTPEIDALPPSTPQLRVNDIVLEPWMTMDKPDAWGTWADMDE
jgi:hypothetical protein